MDVNDRQENGPDQEPTAEGPQAPTGGAGAPPPGTPPPKRLTRSRSDRLIGGVCGGLGRYFNTDPLFFRIGAVALTFLGGAGLLLYLAALFLVPNEDQAAVIAAPPRPALVVAGAGAGKTETMACLLYTSPSPRD